MTPLDVALTLATAGKPVFPCLLDKTPATPHGFKDASVDSAAVGELWRRYPAPLIGIPTGAVSGFDVLDFDFARQPKSKQWHDENRHRLPLTRIHQTRSGGPHFLFQHHDTMRCSAGRIAPGIDTRATGGYVIWWPAHGFPILSDAPLAPWPKWLLDEFRPKPRPAASTNIIPFRGDGWLRGLVRIVATAPEGQRNRILFWAACRAGKAIRAGKATEDFVVRVLIEAAVRAGLSQPEACRTIQSGVNRS